MNKKEVSAVLIVLFFLTAFMLAGGCAHVPPQTAVLSAEVGKTVAEAKRSHLALVDQYVIERRGRVDDFMRYQWTPQFIVKFLKKIKFEKQVCKVKGDLDRAVLVQQLVEAISKQTEKRRSRLNKAVDEVGLELRTAIREHYLQSERMSRTVTSNLRSAVKGKDLQRQILEAVKFPPKPIKMFDEANKKLNDMLTEE